MKIHYYLLDTNILGHLAEFKIGIDSPECKRIEKHWQALPKESIIFLCPINAGEVEYGFRIQPCDPEKREIINKMLSAFKCLDINVELAQNYYADLRARLFNAFALKSKKNNKKKRIGEWKDPATEKELQINENDLWIASVAMAHNLVLVTRDKMHAIRKVAGSDIKFENWLE